VTTPPGDWRRRLANLIRKLARVIKLLFETVASTIKLTNSFSRRVVPESDG
jgi:hypothetical protein